MAEGAGLGLCGLLGTYPAQPASRGPSAWPEDPQCLLLPSLEGPWPPHPRLLHPRPRAHLGSGSPAGLGDCGYPDALSLCPHLSPWCWGRDLSVSPCCAASQVWASGSWPGPAPSPHARPPAPHPGARRYSQGDGWGLSRSCQVGTPTSHRQTLSRKYQGLGHRWEVSRRGCAGRKGEGGPSPPVLRLGRRGESAAASLTCARGGPGGGRGGSSVRQGAWPAVDRARPRPAPGAYGAAPGPRPPGSPPPLRQRLAARATAHGREDAAAAVAVAAGRGGPRGPPAAVHPHPRRPGAARPQGACSDTGRRRGPRSSGPRPGRRAGEARTRAGPGGARVAAWDPHPRCPPAWRVESRRRSWPGPEGGGGAFAATQGWRPESWELRARRAAAEPTTCAAERLCLCSVMQPRGAPHPPRPGQSPGTHQFRVGPRSGDAGSGTQGPLPWWP